MQFIILLVTLAVSLLSADDFAALHRLNALAAVAPPQSVHLSIPAIHVEAAVVPVALKAFPDGVVTWDVSQIDWEVGYFEGTAWFGENSNTVLGGHSELEARQPAVFQRLDRLRTGDVITVRTAAEEWSFVVHQVTTVAVDDLSLLYPTDSAQLTLITCDPQSFSENGSYDRRVVVIARSV